jgi:hypothetical protein
MMMLGNYSVEIQKSMKIVLLLNLLILNDCVVFVFRFSLILLKEASCAVSSDRVCSLIFVIGKETLEKGGMKSHSDFFNPRIKQQCMWK